MTKTATDSATSRARPETAAQVQMVRERWTRDIVSATWALLVLGFVAQGALTLHQIASLDSRCADSGRAHRVLASLTLGEIQTFAVFHGIAAFGALVFLKAGTSRGDRIAGLACALLSGLAALAFALSAGAQGMCWMAGW